MRFRGLLGFRRILTIVLGAFLYSSVAIAEVTPPMKSVHKTGVIRPFYVKTPPSDDKVTETDKEKFYCYDGSKRYSRELLDCQFFFEIKGLLDPADDNVNNGGHDHGYSYRPHSKGRKALRLLGGAQPVGKYGAWGSTLQRGTGIILDVPEVSGRLEVFSSMVAPDGYFCTRDCYTVDSARWKGFYDIVYEPSEGESLVPMPPVSTNGSYELNRDPDIDSNHDDDVAFYGTWFTVQALDLIANELNFDTGRELDINDMSLIRGGLFDVEGDWEPSKKFGHTFHRTGQNADLNREEDLVCGEDKALQRIVDELVPKPTARSGKRMESALVCRPCSKKSGVSAEKRKRCQYHMVIQSPVVRRGT